MARILLVVVLNSNVLSAQTLVSEIEVNSVTILPLVIKFKKLPNIGSV
jgi:hypothetical protein